MVQHKGQGKRLEITGLHLVDDKISQAVAPLDKPQHFQRLESFAQGRPADSQPLRHFSFWRQFVALLQFTA